MKAIIIEEDRFVEIVETMQFKAEQMMNKPDYCGVDPKIYRAIVESVHRCMHYEFVRWAQSHGAKCVR